jgi:drug/metabolite transporter (DMT)-like permease
MRGLGRSQAVCAILLLVAANLLWAGQGVAVKILTDGLGPLTISLFPLYGITIIGIGTLALRHNLMERLQSAWKFRREFFLAGICGQLMAQVGMTFGISWSSASNGAILSLLIPIFGAIIAVWLLRERLTLLRVGSLLIGLAGVVLLSPLQHRAHVGPHTHEIVGNWLIAIGCFGSAFYNVYSKRLLQHFNALETLFFSYLSTTVVSLPVLFLIEPNCLQRLAHLDVAQWAAFGYLAVFLYGVSMVLFLRALESVDTVLASISLYLMPLFGVALAFGILGERLGPHAILGSAIVLIATMVLFRYDYSF